jgi:hypothetical protein
MLSKLDLTVKKNTASNRKREWTSAIGTRSVLATRSGHSGKRFHLCWWIWH